MGKEIIVCAKIEIKKRKFYHHKNLILLEDVDIDKMQVCSMVSPSEKIYIYIYIYINIGYKDNDYKIKPLRTILPKTSAYVKVRTVKPNGCIFELNM